MKDLVAATGHISGDFTSPDKLVALLEFLHMVAPIKIQLLQHKRSRKEFI